MLRWAIALRQEREKKEGKVVSANEVVRESVHEKYEREIGENI